MTRKCWFIVALIFAGAGMVHAAITLADWTFDTSAPYGYGTIISGITAEGGVNAATSIASGFHSTSTSWTSPQGNCGTAHSLSADHWTVGDYFQFTTSTLGCDDIVVTFEQTSSSTGPSAFKLAYSTDGTTFIDITGDSYVVGTTSWTSSGTLKATILDFDLSSITTVNNQGAVYFRLIDTSNLAAGGGYVASGGTSRVDDFEIGATPVPEPAAWGFISALGLLGICGVRLWRQRHASSAF